MSGRHNVQEGDVFCPNANIKPRKTKTEDLEKMLAEASEGKSYTMKWAQMSLSHSWELNHRNLQPLYLWNMMEILKKTIQSYKVKTWVQFGFVNGQ